MKAFSRYASLFALCAWIFAALGQPLQAQSTAAGITPCSTGSSLSVTSTSSNTQLSTCGSAVVVWNIGTKEAFLGWGTASNTAATTSGWSIPAGTAITLNSGRAGLYLAAITAGSDTTTLRIVQGNGPAGIAGGSGGGGGSVTQGTSPWVDNITQWASGVLGAMAAYGTSPGAVLVPGVNAYVTNNGVAQGSTTSGQTLSPVGCRTLSAVPTDTTAQTNIPWCRTNGTQAVDLYSFNGTVLSTSNPVPVTNTPTTAGGLTTYFVQPAASDNHVVIKAGAGQVYWISAFNNSATVNYLRLYNATTGFNGCNSATNLVLQVQIPASTSVGGASIPLPYGLAFSTGISICITSGYATNDTTNATATAMSINIGYN